MNGLSALPFSRKVLLLLGISLAALDLLAGIFDIPINSRLDLAVRLISVAFIAQTVLPVGSKTS